MMIDKRLSFFPFFIVLLFGCFLFTSGKAKAQIVILKRPPLIPTPLPISRLGPNPEDFPPSFNPLTGKQVANPNLLKIPVVLVSISNFPGATRPQMGLSFSDQVYEFWIGVGMTRFLTIFHGSYPSLTPAIIGNCTVRWGPFEGTSPIIGNRVFYDENKNGIQDIGERGIPGICINMINSTSQQIIENTTSDSNGYYGFSSAILKDGSKNQMIEIEFQLPEGTELSIQNDTSLNTNTTNIAINPENGRTSSFKFGAENNFNINAGIRWKEKQPQIPSVGKGAFIRRMLWYDTNHDGIKDEDEQPASGIQVDLIDAQTDAILAVTRTNDKGEYQFELDENKLVYLHILADLGASYTRPKDRKILDKAVNDYEDPINGLSPVFSAQTQEELIWNIGIKEPQAGPLRSGRIVFQTISNYFRDARLFFASKHESVLIGGAGNVYGEDPLNISSAFLDVNRMLEAAKSAPQTGERHYASNIFSEKPPQGGKEGNRLTYFMNVLNTSDWRYDILSETYLRYDDHSDGRGNLYPSVDRLTGRQLQFENVLIMFAEHKQIQGLMIDMEIKPNDKNRALLFRDGKVYPVYWSTINENYEKTTQRLRPPRIVDESGQLFPLKPGRMWIIAVTPRTTIEESAQGIWWVRFVEPPLIGNFIK